LFAIRESGKQALGKSMSSKAILCANDLRWCPRIGHFRQENANQGRWRTIAVTFPMTSASSGVRTWIGRTAPSENG